MWSNVTTVPPRKRNLLHAAVAHRAWLAALESFLLGTRRVPPVLDPQRCRFGQWLESERAKSLGSIAAFHNVDRLHQEAHALANVASAWDPDAAGTDVQAQVRELHRLRDALLEQLNLLIVDAVA